VSTAQAIPLGRLEAFITSSMQRRVLQILIEKPKGVVIQDLINLLYSDRADGGPLYAASSVSVALVRLRAILAPLGWAITKGYGKGGHRPIQLVPSNFVNRSG